MKGLTKKCVDLIDKIITETKMDWFYIDYNVDPPKFIDLSKLIKSEKTIIKILCQGIDKEYYKTFSDDEKYMLMELLANIDNK